jgi:hypothetical protein
MVPPIHGKPGQQCHRNFARRLMALDLTGRFFTRNHAGAKRVVTDHPKIGVRDHEGPCVTLCLIVERHLLQENIENRLAAIEVSKLMLFTQRGRFAIHGLSRAISGSISAEPRASH